MYWPVLIGCVGACVALNFVGKSGSSASSKETAAAATPEFRSFQRSWLTVYLLAMFADWLQGPYVYALYASYGFSGSEIALLFVTGFGSSMFIGTFVGALSDKYGRKAMCLLFAILYTCSALTKVVNSFSVLMLGRLCSGVATSLLFSAFESWMVSEHNRRGFAPALLGDTFSKATQGNGIVAVVAGLVASFCADAFGFSAPFIFAVCPLIVLALLVAPWAENYGNQTADIATTMSTAWNTLTERKEIALLGFAQSIYEGAMYAFVFMWTPALKATYTDPDVKIPFGVVFACFMVSVMIGSSVFAAITASQPVRVVPYIIHGTAALATLAIALGSASTGVVFGAFLLFEATCGLFWPAYGTLRSQYVPEASRAGVANMFRVPLNLLVLVILLGSDKMSPRTVFLICTALHLLALALYTVFDGIAQRAAKTATSATAATVPAVAAGGKKASMKGAAPKRKPASKVE
jgi:MFS family permease